MHYIREYAEKSSKEMHPVHYIGENTMEIGQEVHPVHYIGEYAAKSGKAVHPVHRFVRLSRGFNAAYAACMVRKGAFL
ncbi:hypothetical protein GXP70_06260 [Paenibacillus lycopersici]|uniref:Uncharacterized protein n=1 Tax=Paenibacillus lycopersici TaxID=2704462 RepID=A0A6C0FVX5_9BACL|nr:hypothetical protein [Paenibacillus lycopersici]QHT59593.1 hypothetical protein GXP70_06260 [Paenibacillus lycopersici]